MPESMSEERRRLITAFGAKIELTPSYLGMQGAVDRAKNIVRETPGAFLAGQFDNQANPLIHEQTTAEEIIADTDGLVDVFIAGVGTGGTITGVGRRLKRHNLNTRIIAVEPTRSSVLSGGRCGPHRIQGLGPGFVPTVFDRSIIDEIITVGDQEAYEWTGKIIRNEGIFAGISSGAVACATEKYLKRNQLQNKLLVALFPDSGERYLSVPMLFKGE
jgi:cysteine synthase A